MLLNHFCEMKIKKKFGLLIFEVHDCIDIFSKTINNCIGNLYFVNKEFKYYS